MRQCEIWEGRGITCFSVPPRNMWWGERELPHFSFWKNTEALCKHLEDKNLCRYFFPSTNYVTFTHLSPVCCGDGRKWKVGCILTLVKIFPSSQVRFLQVREIKVPRCEKHTQESCQHLPGVFSWIRL